MMRLTIAPSGLKRRFLDMIKREADRARHNYQAKIMAKVNSLTDIDIIKAMYEASCAGVKIFLCVRGVCMLIPGIAGVSENIRIISIIDHFLEHSRIYYFANGGADDLYLSSADWMTRNLERRVELLFPVQDEKIRVEVLDILNEYFLDNCNARILDDLGVWSQIKPADGEKPFRVQKEMLFRAERAGENHGAAKLEYNVRRSPHGK
jgi:polyphosphate kinase